MAEYGVLAPVVGHAGTLMDDRLNGLCPAVAMKMQPLGLEPVPRALLVPRQFRHELPETRPVIEFAHMRDLVCDDIVDHVRRGEDQAPGERETARRRAAARHPSARSSP